MSEQRAVDLLAVLRQQLALLTGGRDQRGGWLLTVPAPSPPTVASAASSGDSPVGALTSAHIAQLLRYLWLLLSDEARSLGWTVVIDARWSGAHSGGDGHYWDRLVKPLLKLMRDHEDFVSCIHVAYIVRASRSGSGSAGGGGWTSKSSSSTVLSSVSACLTTSKCRFDTCVVTVEQLLHHIDRSQLTPDLGGTFSYNHQLWLDVRVGVEQLQQRASDSLRGLEELRQQVLAVTPTTTATVTNVNGRDVPAPPRVTSAATAAAGVVDCGGLTPVDVATAQRAIERHMQLRLAVYRNTWTDCETLGRRLLTLMGATGSNHHQSAADTESGCSTAGSASTASNCSSLCSSAAFAASRPSGADMRSQCASTVFQTLSQLQTTQRHLQQLWQMRRGQLDQMLQLRALERDVDETLQTVRLKREQFLHTYVDVGRCYRDSKQLQEHHSHFSLSSMNVYVQLNRLLAEATRMIDARHWGSGRVRQLATCMERAWKQLAAGLDERTTVLALAVVFHQRAEQYLQRVPEWLRACQFGSGGDGGGAAAVSANSFTAGDDGGGSAGDGVSPSARRRSSSARGGDQVDRIEAEIHAHHRLYESMCQAYNEVHSTSKKLLFQLDHMVQVCCQLRADAACSAAAAGSVAPPAVKSVTPAADYSGGASHVLSVIRQILNHHRSGEQQWQRRKEALHQQLALQLFEEDVRQVIEWLDTHGDMFLRKNTALGRNLERATAYLRSHEHFVAVAQNTYTNAEKLLAAADELARSGECVAHQVYRVAAGLSERISAFVQRVERRRRLLQLAVTYYSHRQEVAAWHDELRHNMAAEAGGGDSSATEGQQCDRQECGRSVGLSPGAQDVVGDGGVDGDSSLVSPPIYGSGSVQACQHMLEELAQMREPFIEAVSSTLAEGEALLAELKTQGVTGDCDAGGSVAAVLAAQLELRQHQQEAVRLWGTRQLRLDLSLRLRVFERNVMQVASTQLQQWADEYRRQDTAEPERQLTEHNATVDHVLSVLYRLEQEGRQVSQLLHQSGISFMTDSSTTAGERCAMLLDYISERQAELDGLAERRRRRLEQSVQLAQLQAEANQVMTWIRNGEAMLAASFNVPRSLHDAEKFKLEHEQLQRAVERTHASAVQAWRRAETLINTNPYQPDAIRSIAENITRRWQQLVTCAEDRHKLVNSSLSFFKTASEVCVVLEGLERDYSRDEDWCAQQGVADGDAAVAARVTALDSLIDKHQEQKVVFLKACTLARRAGGSFLKYANRTVQYYRHSGYASGATGGVCGSDDTVKEILDNLLLKEGRVMECWNGKKRRLDWCHQYLQVEQSARQALHWIEEKGDRYLRSHSSVVGESLAETEQLLAEHTALRASAKETRERVRRLSQLADNLVEKGHAHAGQICQWVKTVDQAYRDFSQRMDSYRCQLERRQGLLATDKSGQHAPAVGAIRQQGGARTAGRDRLSDSSLETSVKDLSLATTVSAGAADNASVGSGGGGEDCGAPVECQLSEAQRKATRRRAFIMTELLDTERAYVKDLELCVATYLSEAQNNIQSPSVIRDHIDTIFGNMVELLDFHRNTFLQQLQQYNCNPEDVGHCFVTWCHKFDMYVHYCRNKPDSNALVVGHGEAFFEQVRRRHRLEHPIAAFLIKPVQRITKYQLLLKDLLSCCDGNSEIRDGLDVMLGVPKKANDTLHLSMLTCCDVELDSLGEILMQDSFQVWDTKGLIRKGRVRRLFLFELYMVFSKESKDSDGKTRYFFKYKLLTSDLGVTEHVDVDECRFAIWTGRPPLNDFKVTLKANSLDTKLQWIKRLRDLKQDTCFRSAVPLQIPTASSRDSANSLLSTSSSSSLEASTCHTVQPSPPAAAVNDDSVGVPLAVIANKSEDHQQPPCVKVTAARSYSAQRPGELSVRCGQLLELLPPSTPTPTCSSTADGETCRVRVLETGATGVLPAGVVPSARLSSTAVLSASIGTPYPPHRRPRPVVVADNGVVSDSVSEGEVTAGAGGGKRWLPPPLRKLSTNSKLTAVPPPVAVSVTRAISSTTAAPLAVQASSVTESVAAFSQCRLGPVPTAVEGSFSAPSVAEAASDAADELELPPPMCVMEASAVGAPSGPNTDHGPVPSAASALSTDSTAECFVGDVGGEAVDQRDCTAACKVDCHSSVGHHQLACSSPSIAAAAIATSSASERLCRQLVQQLCDSESDYLQQLQLVVTAYIPAISMVGAAASSVVAAVVSPAQRAALLSNVESLVEWQAGVMRVSLQQACSSVTYRCAVELAALFERHADRLLALYCSYCASWPRALRLLCSQPFSDYCHQLQRLAATSRPQQQLPPLADLLHLPVRRPQQYHQLLTRVRGQLLTAGHSDDAFQLQTAVHVSAQLATRCCNAEAAGRLVGVSTADLGRVLLHGRLRCERLGGATADPAVSPPPARLMVFVFEEAVLFSTIDGDSSEQGHTACLLSQSSLCYTHVQHIAAGRLRVAPSAAAAAPAPPHHFTVGVPADSEQTEHGEGVQWLWRCDTDTATELQPWLQSLAQVTAHGAGRASDKAADTAACGAAAVPVVTTAGAEIACDSANTRRH